MNLLFFNSPQSQQLDWWISDISFLAGLRRTIKLFHTFLAKFDVWKQAMMNMFG